MKTQTCRKCRKRKPLNATHWQPSQECTGTGYRRTCRDCRAPMLDAANRRYHAKNPTKRGEMWAKWYAENRDSVLAAGRRYRQSDKGRATARDYERRYREKNRDALNLYQQARRYGLTPADLGALIERQGGACAICSEVAPLQVDHHHKSGKVRELLCGHCNAGLGRFRDRPELLELARLYLIKHNGV